MKILKTKEEFQRYLFIQAGAIYDHYRELKGKKEIPVKIEISDDSFCILIEFNIEEGG